MACRSLAGKAYSSDSQFRPVSSPLWRCPVWRNVSQGIAMSALEQYWSGIGQWLQIQAESFNRLIAHNGEMGRANELTVTDFLAALLPQNLAIGSGLILGTDGLQSRQCDLVVHEVHKHPKLFAQTAQFMFPADTVVMTVEVKTTLDADEVKSIGKNTASVRSAKRAGGDAVRPLTAVFAFGSSATPFTTLKWFRALPALEQPDLVCIVNPGVIIGMEGGTLEGHCVLLHDVVGETKLSGQWIEPDELSSTQSIGGHIYPVEDVRSDAFNGKRVFEPGRALLLFSVRCLAGLGERDLLGTAWWDEYLDPTTREVVRIKKAES